MLISQCTTDIMLNLLYIPLSFLKYNVLKCKIVSPCNNFISTFVQKLTVFGQLTVHLTMLFITGILCSCSSEPSEACDMKTMKKNMLTINKIVSITIQISFDVEDVALFL